MPLSVTITSPDGKSQNFGASLSNSGNYRSIISINENSLVGNLIALNYLTTIHLKSIIFIFKSSNPELPNWIKNNAKHWSSDTVSNSEFIDGIKYLIDEGVLIESDTVLSVSGQELPNWIKNNAKWWANNQISDEDFVQSIQYLIKKDIIRI